MILTNRKMMNNYAGYIPGSEELDRVPYSDIASNEFFEKYILKRRPCIITGMLDQGEFKIPKEEPLKYICDKVKGFQSSVVKVERKSTRTGTFGTADFEKEQMSVRELLQKFKGAGGDEYYLTTQYEKEGSDEGVDVLNEERPNKKVRVSAEDLALKERIKDLLPSPVHSLVQHLPLRPQIVGKLVPQQINVWMGKSNEGSSSGLHHDFHDNLYILLQGRKRFTLFSPKDAEFMKCHGEMAVVEDNGVISYEPEDIDESETESVNSKEDNFRSDCSFASNDEDDDDSEINWNAQDDYDEAVDIEEQEQEQFLMSKEEPPSFSRISANTLHCFMARNGHEGYNFDEKKGVDKEDFELLRKSTPVSVEVQAGEALYLPASWFHEVTSFSTESASEEEEDYLSRLHLAVNYWFFPPDIKNPPYKDDTLEKEFEEIIKCLNEK
jgi:hypothetical protein